MEASGEYFAARFAEQLCAKCQQSLQNVPEAKHITERISRAQAVLREYQEDPAFMTDEGLKQATQGVLSVVRDVDSAVDAATSISAQSSYWESDHRIAQLLHALDDRVEAAITSLTQYRATHGQTSTANTPRTQDEQPSIFRENSQLSMADISAQDGSEPQSQQQSDGTTTELVSTSNPEATDTAAADPPVTSHHISKPFEELRAEAISHALQMYTVEDEGDEPPDEYVCPITQQLMVDPVILVDSGITFERNSIEMWLVRNLSCPVTRQPVRHATLTPNRALKTLISNWVDVHGPTPGARTPMLAPQIPTPPPVPGVISNLQDLQEALKDAQADSVVDLGGARLSGPCQELTISASGVTLKNGSLDIPPGVELRVQASGVRLEKLNLFNTSSMITPAATLIRVEPPPEGEVHDVILTDCGAWSSASQTAGILLEGCADAHIERCKVRRVAINGPASQATLTDCEVYDGMSVGPCEAVALLERCSLFGNSSGLLVQGSRSSLTARSTRITDTQKACMYVLAGARADLEECEMSGSKELNGMVVQDKGSTVAAKSCRFVNNKNSNVWVHRGARLTLDNCDLSTSKSRSGLQVQDEGSTVTAKNCKFVGNQSSGVSVMDKAGPVELDTCELTGSRSDADLFVSGAPSFLKLRRCAMDNYINRAVEKR